MKANLFGICSIAVIFLCSPGFFAFGANKMLKSTVYTTAENTALKISQTGTLQFHTAQQPIEKDIWVFVDPSQKYQSIVGIGGAITDAAAETFAKLPESAQKELLTAFYDSKNGLGYSIIRTNIGSCDFFK